MLLTFPLISQAETQLSVGTGYQHGSALGIQYGFINGANKYYAALGLVGFAVGYERAIDNSMKHTLGFSIGSEQITSENGFVVLTYNYHFDGMPHSGWKVGVSAGVRREDSTSVFGDVSYIMTQNAVSFDVAYKF
jgi:hypothetical protein